MTEPTGVVADAVTGMFNLPDYHVIAATVLQDGRRRVVVETHQLPGGPSFGVVGSIASWSNKSAAKPLRAGNLTPRRCQSAFLARLALPPVYETQRNPARTPYC